MIGSRKHATLNLGKLSSNCRELRELLEDLASVVDPSQRDVRAVQKAESHARLALKHLNSIACQKRGTDELFPALKDTLESIIASKLEGEEPAESEDASAPQHEAAAPAMSSGFHGDTGCLGLGELINFLSVNRKDGVLNVMFQREIITVWFSGGDLVHAVSNQSEPGDRLGDILVEQGAIGRRDLESEMAAHADSTKPLGRTLEEAEVITREELMYALEEQTRRIFLRLYKQEEAHYSFRERLPDDFKEQYRLNVTQLLLDTARQKDEADSLIA